MNVNGSNPTHIPAAEPVVLEKKVQHAAIASAAPKDKVVETRLDLRGTNVVVEMERNNTLVFKFIDEKTGKVIQQFPPQQMVHQNQIVPAKKQD
jgi:uncharacterized FlaG/YvyC family protein